MRHSRPAKILYIIDYLYGLHGGTEGQLIELIDGLDRDRFNPSLAVFQGMHFSASHEFHFPIQVLGIDSIISLRTFFRLIDLSRFVRLNGIDIVHIYFNDASIAAPAFSKAGGAKVIVSRRDMGFWYTRQKLLALKLSNRFVDRFLTNCWAVKKNVCRQEAVAANMINVIYNGQQSQKFDVPADPHFRRMHGIGSNDRIIGMVGNLYPIKRPIDMIKAFALVLERFKNTHLVLAGGGELEITPLREYVGFLGIGNNIHFLGRVSDVVPIIKHFSVCVLTSESEGLSNAILEYMGCSKPTVCTRAGGNPELIRDAHDGFLINVGDLATLADRIIKLLSDPDLATRMGSNAKQTFEGQFSQEQMLNAHASIYDELLNTT